MEQQNSTEGSSYFETLKRKSIGSATDVQQELADELKELKTNPSVGKAHTSASAPVTRTSSGDSAYLKPSGSGEQRRAARKVSSTRETTEIVHDEGDDDDGDGVEKLNQYVVKKELGRGAFGVVKLVHDTDLNEDFAMKVMSKKRLKRKQLMPGKKPASSPLDGVKREIAILKKLEHENIVNLIEVMDSATEDNLYLVLELMDGGTVQDIEAENCPPLSADLMYRYFREMTLGVEYLHFQHIIHRDLKPDNLLLNKAGDLKIADFGVSHIFEGDDDSLQKTAGSPAFLAPEVLSTTGEEYSGKGVDIWAMGVTLYCFVYGKPPFLTPNIIDLHEMILNDSVPFPEDTPIDGDLKNLLGRILEKDPKKRITMEEIKVHPWVTKNGIDPLPSTEENCELVEVSEREVTFAVRPIPSLATVVLVKSMIHRASFSRRGNNRKSL